MHSLRNPTFDKLLARKGQSSGKGQSDGLVSLERRLYQLFSGVMSALSRGFEIDGGSADKDEKVQIQCGSMTIYERSNERFGTI